MSARVGSHSQARRTWVWSDIRRRIATVVGPNEHAGQDAEGMANSDRVRGMRVVNAYAQTLDHTLVERSSHGQTSLQSRRSLC